MKLSHFALEIGQKPSAWRNLPETLGLIGLGQ